MGKNDGLIIAAVVAGVIFLPGLLNKEENGGSLLPSFMTGEGGGFPDMSGLFSGLGDMLGGLGGEGGVLGDFGGGLNNMFAGLGNLFSGFTLPGGGDGGGIVGEGGLRGLISETGGQTRGIIDSATDLLSEPFRAAGTGVKDAATGIGFGAMDVSKAVAIAGGTYLGVKTLAPIAPKLGGAVANIFKTPLGKSPLLNMVKSGGNAGANLGKAALNLLKTPVSQVASKGVFGVLGTAGAVAGAGYGGYKLGEFLMNKTPLGEITGKAAESLGASAARSPFWGQKLFGVAQVGKLSSTTQSNFQNKYGISLAQAKIMTTSQLQSVMAAANKKATKTVVYKSTPKVTMTSSQEKKAQQNAANAAFLQGMAAMGWK